MSESTEKAGSLVPTQVNLSPTTSLDLSWLPEEQRRALLADHAKGTLDIARKAQELHVDVAALKASLSTLSDATQEVAQSGNSVTIAHTQNTSVGRTEILMGNTDKAKGGKLTSSQTGATDWTPWYIFGGLLALVLIAASVFGHH
jgi:hypothetical protein